MEEENKFKSCIKIRGVPILPPLVTQDQRGELLELKKKAVMLEKIYGMRKKANISEQLSTKDDGNQIELQTNKKSNVDQLEKLWTKSDTLYVPYLNREKYNSVSTLQCLDTSNFSSSEIYTEELSNNTQRIPRNDVQNPENHDTKPRLIRSNSYTLETPSTILLDHLRKQRQSMYEEKKSPTQHTALIESSQWNFDKTQNEVDISSTNEKINLDRSNVENVSINNTKDSKLSLEVVTTDITVQEINFTRIDESFTQTNLSHEQNLKFPANCSDLCSTADPESELQEILKRIPEVYANKIVELIGAQQKKELTKTQGNENSELNMLESEHCKENPRNFLFTQRILTAEASNTQSNDAIKVSEDNGDVTLRSLDSDQYLEYKSISSSLNESQTMPLTISTSTSDSLDDFSLKTFKILDLDECERDTQLDKIELDKDLSIQNERSKEMNFFEQKESQLLSEEKAASIIVAHVKGYLVRRLMDTLKVKTIIQTIQDALLCALELESSEKIEEVDVEFHRKLIKLVSSAYIEFHSIFFDLSIPEKMDIIARDREKLKRTVGARTTRSSTVIRQNGPTSNVRYTKSSIKL